MVSDVWPEPATLFGTDRGPTLVSIAYRVHPDRFTEQWEVDSWTEHLRQHERVTETDHEIQTAVRDLLVEPAEVRHFVAEP